MKKLKKFIVLIMAVICLTMSFKDVKAGYKYHVTILAGLHGTLSYNGETGLDKIDVYLEPGAI